MWDELLVGQVRVVGESVSASDDGVWRGLLAGGGVLGAGFLFAYFAGVGGPELIETVRGRSRGLNVS